MTSSKKTSINKSSYSQDASSTAQHSDNKNPIIEDATTAEIAVPDDTIKNTEILEDSETIDEFNERTDSAQSPETTITIETLGPDEVVATLEPSAPKSDSQPKSQSFNEESATIETTETESEETASDFFQTKDTATTEKTKDNAQNDSDSNLTANELLTNPQKTEVDAKGQNVSSLTNIKNANQDDHQDQDENSDIKGSEIEGSEIKNFEEKTEEEEEVQEKKEAKLESYKQFVAEQFSNQKVDHPEVRVRIEANALPSKMYFIMNILSAIIASYGLVTNSAAVVIGAMLVAMMLGPITGVALAIIDHRMPLLRKSLFTVIAGVSLVVLVGFLVGWLHKDQPLTIEILSRTQPTSMDLMIALAGGTAGAYAMVSPHLSVAVVGVAVATALVPPLAASGILFANGDMKLGFGALLLALTNIIAIQFTNALVLWLLGFRRLVDDDYKSSTYFTFLRRNAVTLLLLGGLGTYLSINLQTNAKQQVFESNVKETINQYFSDKGNVLTNTQFNTANESQIIRAVIRGETTPSSYDVQQIETLITQDMDKNFPDYLPVKLQLRYMPVQVIESHPLIKEKLDKTDVTILTN